jgi:hypothetical protein
MALRAFRRFVKFAFRKLETAGATAGGLDRSLVFCMLEAAEKMIQVVRDLIWRLVHNAGNAPDAHRIFEQQLNQVFAKHTTALQERSSIAAPTDFLHTSDKPPGLVFQPCLFVELRQVLIPIHNIEAQTEFELEQAHRATPVLEHTAPTAAAEMRTALRMITSVARDTIGPIRDRVSAGNRVRPRLAP